MHTSPAMSDEPEVAAPGDDAPVDLVHETEADAVDETDPDAVLAAAVVPALDAVESMVNAMRERCPGCPRRRTPRTSWRIRRTRPCYEKYARAYPACAAKEGGGRRSWSPRCGMGFSWRRVIPNAWG